MNRRGTLKLMALGAGVAGFPPALHAATTARVAVYDGRFPLARHFARTAEQAHDCAADAAGLWHGALAADIRGGAAISGLTTPADAMVMEDCARRAGLQFEHGRKADGGRLAEWTIRAPHGRSRPVSRRTTA